MVRNIQQAATCEVYLTAWKPEMTIKKALSNLYTYVVYFFLKWVMKSIDKESSFSILKISSATQRRVPPQTGNDMQWEHFFQIDWLGPIRK